MLSTQVTGVSQEKLQTVFGWDMSAIRQRMAFKYHLTEERLDALELGYKQYICMMIANPDEEIVVSTDIDDFAHEHILFTDDYDAFMRAVGGRIEHCPVKSQAEIEHLATAYHGRSIPLVQTIFGSEAALFL